MTGFGLSHARRVRAALCRHKATEDCPCSRALLARFRHGRIHHKLSSGAGNHDAVLRDSRVKPIRCVQVLPGEFKRANVRLV
ncbi:hypothetical protein HNR07_004265 [Nocardiopsis metallicus]|uniref:Uncharacterized protein n=1 Tax=Nocardiopsis metallicus TaxID=179819 RepID=A0A840WSM1_9ACTN|nr:hypothetical protein [Nocardiopsis metallicus]